MIHVTRLTLILGFALLLTAPSTHAASTAVLSGTTDGETLVLTWEKLGEADSLALHWRTVSGDRGEIGLDGTQRSLTLPVPEETTAYYLAIDSGGTTGYSNTYSSGPFDCHPQRWIDIIAEPPFVVIHWDCFLP